MIPTMEIVLTESIGLLMAASFVAILARRLHLPYTVGLVLAGIALAFTHLGGQVKLTHDLIFDLILPPLLFEAALAIHWHELKRDALPILILSVFGVIISCAVVTAGMAILLKWPLAPALLFGVLISATDPVAVIAMFKDTGVGGRLRLLVESESLFNDGVAAVFFVLALGFAQATGSDTAASGFMSTSIVIALAHTALGGIGVGLLCGGAAIFVIGRADDYLIETAVTTVAAYGAFLIAEHFGCSGVLATVAAGLLIGNLGILAEAGPHGLSSRGREFVIAFWEFVAFLANSMIFLLIGLTVAGTAFNALSVTALFLVNLFFWSAAFSASILSALASPPHPVGFR